MMLNALMYRDKKLDKNGIEMDKENDAIFSSSIILLI